MQNRPYPRAYYQTYPILSKKWAHRYEITLITNVECHKHDFDSFVYFAADADSSSSVIPATLSVLGGLWFIALLVVTIRKYRKVVAPVAMETSESAPKGKYSRQSFRFKGS